MDMVNAPAVSRWRLSWLDPYTERQREAAFEKYEALLQYMHETQAQYVDGGVPRSWMHFVITTLHSEWNAGTEPDTTDHD